jgi:hypothetical protein
MTVRTDEIRNVCNLIAGTTTDADIYKLAELVRMLADECEALQRVLDARTAHLV